ncbi:hypothetical protein IFR05_015941 [Cadophora sp. M221]|nr:hypothetical protein IFR05_015941 [Cadophora sp. M221]
MADVRELFFKVAPQFIYQFFIRISSTPHNLNIFPVGVPEEFFSRLRDAVNTTADVLEILAAIVSLYLMYEDDQNQGNGNGQAGIQHRAQDAHVLNVDVPQELGELRMLF